MRARVQVAHESERPVRVVAAVALLAFVGGLAGVRVTMHARPGAAEDARTGLAASEAEAEIEGEPAAEPEAAAEPEPEGEPGAEAEVEAAAEPEPEVETEVEAAAEAESEAEAEVEAAAESETEADAESGVDGDSEVERVASGLELEWGRLAYIRCRGIERGDGSCPRDAELESGMRRVIEGLTGCPGITAGSGDVRFHLGAGATEVRFRDWGDTPVAAGTLQRCLEAPAAGLRSGLNTADLVVSLRFRLAAR